MARDLSEIIEQVLEQESQSVWLAVDITLPDDETVFRAAEIELTVTSLNLFGTSVECSSTIYPSLLKQEPAIKFVNTKAPSGGELSIYDIHHDLGILTGQIEETLENSKIVISTCWEKSDGTFEADIYFVGRIRDIKAEDTETKFNVISDTDVKTALVADRALTQRCLADYGDNRCGRPAELIEEGETCSNLWDDAENGCLAKRWRFRFWGVPILVLKSDLQSNGGWGGGTVVSQDCVSIENYISILDDAFNIVKIKAEKAETGMTVIDALCRTAKIDKVEFVFAEKMFEVVCENGARVECSDSHPIIRSIYDGIGTATAEMKIGDEVLCLNLRTRKNSVSKIKHIDKIKGRMVAKIHLSNSSASLYVACADEADEIAICGHNSKNHNTNVLT